jgi:methionyl-tRNA formyltransferase
VGCGQHSTLEILEVQPEGKKRIPARDFANGARLIPNERLGEIPSPASAKR